jgi:Uma2 family endonuclease
MSLTLPAAEILYPESDGKPMGETDLHRYWMNRIYDLLTLRLTGQRAYVGCDLLVYYTEARPIDYCVPDVFVAIGAKPGFRRTYKTWAEGQPPTVVFEVTSASTRREDEVFKPQTYTQMGVEEYFLYDPTADYLKPPLIGYRLAGADRGKIAADEGGALHCVTLGLKLSLHETNLILADAATGRQLLTEAEAAEARADEEAHRRELAEAEIRRLQAEIEKLRGSNGH